MKKVFVQSVLVTLIFAGGCLWYWTRSPGYAIRELKHALDTRDLALLYSRIDLPSLYHSALDALATKGLSETETPPSFLDKLGSQISTGSEKLTQGQSLDLIKHELEGELRRDREKSEALASHLTPHSLRRFLHDVLRIEWKESVINGEEVLLNTEIHLLKLKEHYPLTLRWKRSEDGRWRLMGFEGLASLLSRYDADRARAVVEHNRNVQKLLEEKLPFFGETRIESKNGGLSSTLYLDVLFQNKFDNQVRKVKGIIRDTSEPSRIEEVFEEERADIPTGEKKVFLLKKSQYLSPSEAGAKALRFSYSEIELQSGKSFRLVKDFDEISN